MPQETGPNQQAGKDEADECRREKGRFLNKGEDGGPACGRPADDEGGNALPWPARVLFGPPAVGRADNQPVRIIASGREVQKIAQGKITQIAAHDREFCALRAQPSLNERA
jgi:hypothetical protein